jgi:hypothetical protein
VSAKSTDSADSLDSEIVTDLSDELKRRWNNLYKVKLTGALDSFSTAVAGSHWPLQRQPQQARPPPPRTNMQLYESTLFFGAVALAAFVMVLAAPVTIMGNMLSSIRGANKAA